MKYIEALDLCLDFRNSVFLGGGISNCHDWQSEIVKYFEDVDFTILNPRRKNFPIDDPKASETQIKWEYHHLMMSKVILFWFPCETLCPITLFELGCWIRSGKQVFVGVHPDYKRRLDIEVQSSLIRPEMKIVYNVKDLANQVITNFKA